MQATLHHLTGNVSAGCLRVLSLGHSSFLSIGFIAFYHGISLQQYADDTQLYISVSTADLTVNLATLESCLQSLHCWLCHNSLALNSNKSDTILFGTTSRMRKFPSVPGINIAGNLIPLSDKIVTLGVTLDCRLALSDHISNVCPFRSLSHTCLYVTSDLLLRKTWPRR